MYIRTSASILILGRMRADGTAHLSVWAAPELQAMLRHQLFLTRRRRKFEVEPDTATFEDTWIDIDTGRTGNRPTTTPSQRR